MKNNNFAILVFVIALIGIFCSCDQNRVFQDYQKIDKYIWDKDNAISFEFDIEDTTSLHNLYVNIRHSGIYPFNNLWLFINSTAPNGMSTTDTLECLLADNSGKWLGKGSGDLWDNKVLWKQMVRFPIKGTYTVTYRQGMRMALLPGILDVGLRIERIDNTN